MNTFPARIQAQRGHAQRTQSWLDIVRSYTNWVAYGLPYVPMLRLVESLAVSPVATELFAAPSMHDLLLSDHADFLSADSTLFVRYLPSRREFCFEHRAFSGPNDEKVCPESEGLLTLSLFLRYKYGILLSGAVA